MGRKKLQEKCGVEGCVKEFYAKGKCRAHYNQSRKKPKGEVVVEDAAVVEAQAASLESEEAKP